MEKLQPTPVKHLVLAMNVICLLIGQQGHHHGDVHVFKAQDIMPIPVLRAKHMPPSCQHARHWSPEPVNACSEALEGPVGQGFRPKKTTSQSCARQSLSLRVGMVSQTSQVSRAYRALMQSCHSKRRSCMPVPSIIFAAHP